MATKYQVKITQARFVVRPLSGPLMAEIGQSVIGSIFARWDAGLDVRDQTAPPLRDTPRGREGAFNPGGVRGRSRSGPPVAYRVYKQQKTGSSIRDLNLTGRLRRSITVLSSGENTAVLGPVNGMHSRQLSNGDVLARNQLRWRMWGVSPTDREKLLKMVVAERPLRAQIVRA